ncbi:chorismate mutase [Pannonibacter sp. Pt2-lr]|uniref:chorismate mutase n=1 Tax=Pannonibacter anstelovis TaxID=3121537 RepID=A0ABU7ZK29_9HYPH
MKPAKDCVTKGDIRTEIDRIDQLLLKLFAERQTYVRQMAQIKQHPDEAFDAERIETMIERLRGRAEGLGLEAGQAEAVWRVLIDWNVDYERRTIAARLGLAPQGTVLS